jgi:tetratricopeptide (TPR) repeat protein
MGFDTKRKHYIIVALLLAATGVTVSTIYHVVERKWVMFRKAENLVSSGRLNSAIQYYKSALDLGLDHEKIYVRLGGAYLATARFESAREVFEKLLTAYPDSRSTFVELLSLYDRLGLVEEALDLCHSHRGKWEGDPAVTIFVAGLHRRKDDLDSARTLYRDALKYDPGSVPARLGLSEVLASVGRYQEAIRIVEDILVKKPSDRTARIYLARFMSWSGNLEGAIEEYRKVVP